MRTLGRLGALVGLAIPIGLLSTVAAPGAVAADSPSTPKVVQSNWYWYHQTYAADGTGLETAPEPSGVPKGDLAVAYTGGTTSDSTQPSKETYLAFDLSAIDPASSVTSFSFTLTLDGAAQLKTTPPALIACSPVRTWSNGDGTSWFDKPTDDCSTAVAAPGKVDTKTGTYTFDIPSLAQSWLAGVNTGVAIRQDPDPKKQSTPFQLNFQGPAKVTAKLGYVPPLTAAYQPPPPPQPAPAAGTGTSTGTLSDTGGSGGLAPAPAVAPATPATPAPAPQVAPQPQAAPVAHISPASTAPSAAFWLLAVLLLSFLALVSLVVGDTEVAQAASRPGKRVRVSRLDHVLRSRRTSLTLEPR
jgi:hypothetical protein